MKLCSTTADFCKVCGGKSVAAPLELFARTPFRNIDLSFYRVIYEGSPWIAEGDGWKREVEDCLRLRDKYGFRFVQAHSPDGEHFVGGEKRDALLRATERSIEACAMLGIPHTVIHAGVFPGDTPTEFIRRNTAFYKLFEETAERAQVDMLTENSAEQNMPTYYLRTGKELVEFIRMAGIPRLHVCWDVGHANMRGNDQIADLRDLGTELHAVHIHDNFGDQDSHFMPMVGTVNYDDILQGLIENGFKGYFTFECENCLRPAGSWPNFRRNVKPTDRLADPSADLQIMQVNVVHAIGKWMLESYGLYEE